ncbi:hypothetical protein LT330_007156 [Penicillium expansum]|uniref:DUF2293 domain-containing protein n=1 Tax=Penicillium expansum TaxID=27334 RepID=A0A0A2KFH4_PENEN|nr:protein of unknown function DUF2293 [Penicillium expansum]KAK4868434.1 hypothetical protein LT330_007156 [Penicillium expansum]KGO40627.1 protein of unknown function DUF2293 [Penicillium expansum]KGO48904.1 protein of unknown function DUF2293 [Penicillium expansum]KGO63100.1 protein of unknown function DUF2293 [Penicillium expansum]
MAPTTKPKVRKRKPRVRKKNRGIRTREGHARPADAGSPVQPLAEVLNETKKRRKPKKTWTGLIPVSDDPLEKNIVEQVPLPNGYVLVPKGDVYITRHCRSKTKESERIVYVVYNRTGKRTLGIRVPKEIYTEVLESAAETKESRANAVQVRDARDLSKSRELLKNEFPLMPKESLKIVLEHAFLKGSGRVGRTAMISDEKKTLLAVEAHIRHVHTPYEKLLEEGVSRKDAREQVWSTIQAVERAWQGCENGETTLALRPVDD